MDKKEIIAILMRRDNISHEEAVKTVQECQDEIDDILSNMDITSPFAAYDEVEEALKYHLGLEPDYIYAFIR